MVRLNLADDLLFVLLVLLGGCATYRAALEARDAPCAAICDRYSGVPVMTAARADGPRRCQCDAFPSTWERASFPGTAWSVTVTCEPDCVTVAEDDKRLRELQVVAGKLRRLGGER